MSVATTARSACLRVAGELDYETTNEFIDTVAGLLTSQPALAHVHLDFSELAFCDSAGLSGLLLVHRRMCQAGVHLHLDHRPAHLDRILQITGTFEHLVATSPTDAATVGPPSPGESRVR
ncbi:STAS domain-containing protein [Mycobacterium parmense]|uniref:Anti-sigma factor antagonist n=1 Tax=Mycobacterium parmense TaxID=185642 RepID=A0A7I7YQU8_9MYCO|nr:STAS domain-containing protein [Mycobacterium parmense]BBZ43647.1 anti-sigma factor antagonist [Mycobacterium parmense]